eukprot:TRINITY_DN15166_c0_g1_i3.p1 TRINITY_DN15166_c0_g1~~TRINITY_DN15166_c0_g1_i3.p1  ORF type:complete len:226 (+),score=48.13 TRINITY_DN15166_c0_g1_i3:58-678(+)
MWKKWRTWRAEYKVDTICEEEVKDEVRTGKAFWHGVDKQNRPCVIILPRNHHPGQNPVEQTVRYSVFMIEQGIRLLEEKGADKICVIYDREGMSRKNFDLSLLTVAKSIVGVLQDYYAERLGRLYILNVNWFFWTIYKVVSPLLSQRTRDKICILRSNEELKQHFDDDELLRAHGGTSDYVHPYPSDHVAGSPEPDDDNVEEKDFQ